MSNSFAQNERRINIGDNVLRTGAARREEQTNNERISKI